ncbi:unnamed protein product (macronuclear) [Paramecium tetraurelia]|uniref:Uncharacterized protein n=1 Tax=Paramecium tetraurelia TaxID=5888 RepID=A0CR12_PARTE|nr:uncharacterized protein GSPATT00009542001 [Paramecium tetraurelia]CAK73229.1 unnamed protein product [Paramecium tetraurelia]|eukprot:XP_001440626.1 hypothetical protein (macronuclear) [Paramecium tetraurelia strain d4-2]
MSQHNSRIDHHFLSQQYESFNQLNKENIFDEVNRMIELYKSQNELKKIKQQKHLSPQKLIYSLLTKTNTKNKNKVSLSQNIGQKKLTQSPISIKQKSLPQQSLQCSFHQPKKAQFFDSNLRNQNKINCQEFSILNCKNSQKLNVIHHKNSLTENLSINQPNYKSLCEDAFSIEYDENNENQYKQQQLDNFQQAIKSLLNECNNIVQISQSNDYEIKYNSLQYQLEQMLTSINKKSLKLVNQLQFNEKAQQLSDIQEELNSIQVDINQNEQNILTNMQIKPFKYIMRKYKDKLSGYHQIIKSNEFNQQKQFIDERLKQLSKIKTMLNNYFNRQNQLDSISQSQQLSSRRKIKNSNVYISFENKEMFQIAAQSEQGYLLESPNFIQI